VSGVRIHPTASVDPAAELGDGVSVGPFAVIGAHVRIGDGCVVGPHCVLDGHTRLGRNNRLIGQCSIGAPPQDKKYRGEPTRLEIGDDNTFREFVTINTGTVQDEGVTRVGDDNWVMAYVHIAHDCRIGSHTIIANGTQLGGHVHLGDHAFLGGLCGVHQFVRVGAHAMTGFQTRLSQDLPPFVTAVGNPAAATGINVEGMRRRGRSAEQLTALRRAYRLLYREGLTLEQSRAAIEQMAASDAEPAAADLRLLADFLARATRGIVRP
jgi:UDP-N-acetylglucosamine acyltransferase